MALIRCKECGREISSRAPTCIGCGAPQASIGQSGPSSKAETVVVYKIGSSAGVLTGILGSVFATLGILTIALIFLPFALLFSIVSLLRSVSSPNVVGIVLALVSCSLTVVCFVTSPTALVAALAVIGFIVGFSHGFSGASSTEATGREPVATVTQYSDMCPGSGNAAKLQGTATQQVIEGRGTVWVLQTNKPFCLLIKPPIAVEQKAILSSVELVNAAPSPNTTMEFSGKLHAMALSSDGKELPRLIVISQRKID